MPVYTPDRRYLVVEERLWRAANPALSAAENARLTRDLMAARREVGRAMRAGDAAAERKARRAVHHAKVALGERGAVWWDDGAPDYNRRLIRNTPYAGWWQALGRYRQAILEMLRERGAGKSVCPSDVARREQPKSWRARLEDVRTAARILATEERIVITQGDRELDPQAAWRGPVRFRLWR